jgi:hypothetical protein
MSWFISNPISALKSDTPPSVTTLHKRNAERNGARPVAPNRPGK